MALNLNGQTRSVIWTLTWLNTAAGDILAAPHDPARVVEIAARMRAATLQLARLLEVPLDG